MMTTKRWAMTATLLVALIVAAGAAIAFMGEDGPPATGESGAPDAPVFDSDLPQARWVVRTFAAGTAGPPKKEHRKAVAREKEDLSETVTTVIDSITVGAESIRSLAGSDLTPGAAKALTRSGLALPERLEDVQMIKRKADIGLDANGGKRAAALVKTVVKGTIDGSDVKLAGETKLYLLKGKGGWQVVAFDSKFAPKTDGSKDKAGGKGRTKGAGQRSKKKGKS